MAKRPRDAQPDTEYRDMTLMLGDDVVFAIIDSLALNDVARYAACSVALNRACSAAIANIRRALLIAARCNTVIDVGGRAAFTRQHKRNGEITALYNEWTSISTEYDDSIHGYSSADDDSQDSTDYEEDDELDDDFLTKTVLVNSNHWYNRAANRIVLPHLTINNDDRQRHDVIEMTEIMRRVHRRKRLSLAKDSRPYGADDPEAEDYIEINATGRMERRDDIVAWIKERVHCNCGYFATNDSDGEINDGEPHLSDSSLLYSMHGDDCARKQRADYKVAICSMAYHHHQQKLAKELQDCDAKVTGAWQCDVAALCRAIVPLVARRIIIHNHYVLATTKSVAVDRSLYRYLHDADNGRPHCNDDIVYTYVTQYTAAPP